MTRSLFTPSGILARLLFKYACSSKKKKNAQAAFHCAAAYGIVNCHGIFGTVGLTIQLLREQNKNASGTREKESTMPGMRQGNGSNDNEGENYW